MDTRRFVSAYQMLPEKKTPSNPERREILDAPRKWMRFFDMTMRNYLNGEPVPPMDEFLPQLYEYYDWNRDYLGTLMKRARAIDDPTNNSDISNEFTFHQLNGPLAFMWHQLLYPEADRYTPDNIETIQAQIAVSMAPSVQRLKTLQDKGMLPEEAKEYAQLKGDLSEGDSVITLLELVKQEPTLVVVPAPESFEHNRNAQNRNADILLIDTVNSFIHGIQVKTDTVYGAGGRKHYDPTYVSVVDSTYELGNMVYDRSNPNKRKALPGQVAMGLLAERPIKKVPITVFPADYLRSRQIARELSRGKHSFLVQAVSHLANRIIPELKKDPEDEQTIINNQKDLE